MNISGISNVSFGGRLEVYGKPKDNNYNGMKDTKGRQGVYYSKDEGTVLIDTDCIESVSSKSIALVDSKERCKRSSIELDPYKNLAYPNLLTAYIAACQKPNTNIVGYEEQ